MLNMTLNKKEEPYFITDVDFLPDDVCVKYADGHVENMGFCNDNIKEFYRRRLLEQVQKYVEPYIKEAGRVAFRAYIQKYGLIIAELVEIYALYNVDIHIVMKLILGVFLIFINGIMVLAAAGDLLLIGDTVGEAFALEYYANNYADFTYVDEETNETINVLPIEEISKSNLSLEIVKQIHSSVLELKEQNAKKIGVFLVKKDNIRR